MAILFVSGVNDRSVIGVTLDKEGNPVYLIDGNASVHRRLPIREGVAASFLIFGKGVPQHSVEFKVAPSLVFNQIADPDTHRGALERCVELCDQVNTTVINHPRHVLRTTRDQVSQILQGIPNVVVPRTQRFAPASPDEVFSRASAENFDFPFIVRVAGEHGGREMIRIDSSEDYALLHAFPFDGRAFYLTEFVSCADAQGFCHRQRLVVIDGEPILRGSLYDKSWKVHGASRSFMLNHETWEDDRRRSNWLEKEVIPPLIPAIEEITRRLQLEYYGIDCNMDPDGGMLLFEANANMNILTNDHPELNQRMQRIERRIHDLLTRYSGEKVI